MTVGIVSATSSCQPARLFLFRLSFLLLSLGDGRWAMGVGVWHMPPPLPHPKPYLFCVNRFSWSNGEAESFSMTLSLPSAGIHSVRFRWETRVVLVAQQVVSSHHPISHPLNRGGGLYATQPAFNHGGLGLGVGLGHFLPTCLSVSIRHRFELNVLCASQDSGFQDTGYNIHHTLFLYISAKSVCLCVCVCV